MARDGRIVEGCERDTFILGRGAKKETGVQNSNGSFS